MPKLRLNHFREADGRHRVEALLELEGRAPQTAVSTFAFELTPQEREDLRWYLEDYLQFPHEPAPTIARRIERRMDEVGNRLFQEIFQTGDDARDLWANLRLHLNETRIEIGAAVREVESIPWELLRDARTDSALALLAPAFIRARHGTARPVKLPSLPTPAGEKIRILLVICRPGGRADVPFRSVAGKLIKGLKDEKTRARYQLDVLRPPSFARLAAALRQANKDGRPYHAVHFDGHGAYLKTPEEKVELREWLRRLGAVMLGGPRPGSHGYLVFENPQAPDKTELVGGPALGDLLYETQTPVLVLNACRSAHAEPEEARGPDGPQAEAPNAPDTAGQTADSHRQIRAFASLAQEVVDQGVAGVVAMRYNVYVVTAAQFVADLYGALAQGATLGEAVSYGRKQLAIQDARTIAYDSLPLQDWQVPVVFEAAPIQLFPKIPDGEPLRIEIAAGAAAGGGGLDPALPREPDTGFFGRDETLLALDRAFDDHPIVLLHAFAGSGKTVTAGEFARWYHQTGGLRDGRGADGPVLFTSFEHHTPLRAALGHFGRIFGPTLEAAGLNWTALTKIEEMRSVALQVMAQVPLLWIWDNVEPVGGFPCGSPSAWSPVEQNELLDFLRDARGTKARILLTSRREENDWLGELPARVAVPPMPMLERVGLARSLCEKRGHRFASVDDWRPLLRFTQGNPLTITVLVGQALKEGRTSEDRIRDFVRALEAGEAQFEDEQKENRSKSLGASLSYGFNASFSDEERRRLALLHLFQGFVDVNALRQMGSLKQITGEDFSLPEIKGLGREDWIGPLDRAADIGLLVGHGGGYYSIHPALPWFFKSLFDQYYPDRGEQALAGGQSTAWMALRAFIEALGGLGNFYTKEYEGGIREVIGALEAEEANLLHARRLARRHGWPDAVIGAMQGLRVLYDHTGRRTEWRGLVEEIVPDFIVPATDDPLPGREENYSLIMQYRVRLAREARDWAAAERLQRKRVEWDRHRAAPYITQPAEKLAGNERNLVRNLAVSLHEMAEIQRERGSAACVENYNESLAIAEQIDDRYHAATCAFNLGHVYIGDKIPELRDLDQAESWYRRSLEMRSKDDHQGRSLCLGQLGMVAQLRFLDARAVGKPEDELSRLLNEAFARYHEALELTPINAVNDLAAIHNALGAIYGDAGDLGRALPHFNESIQLEENQGNYFGAGQTRLNVAIALADAGRLADARDYALAALRNFESYGDRAAAEIEKTRGFLARIEELIRRKINHDA